MQNIGNHNETRRSDLLAELRATHEVASEKVADANKAIEEANEAIADYIRLVDDANTFAQEVAAEIAEYIGERSEKWQEGEKGQAYLEWQTEWEAFNGEAPDQFDALEEPNSTAIDELENTLPSEPNL